MDDVLKLVVDPSNSGPGVVLLWAVVIVVLLLSLRVWWPSKYESRYEHAVGAPGWGVGSRAARHATNSQSGMENFAGALSYAPMADHYVDKSAQNELGAALSMAGKNDPRRRERELSENLASGGFGEDALRKKVLGV
jgi:hypothetical protein